jgi:hypothetical protein
MEMYKLKLAEAQKKIKKNSSQKPKKIRPVVEASDTQRNFEANMEEESKSELLKDLKEK